MSIFDKDEDPRVNIHVGPDGVMSSASRARRVQQQFDAPDPIQQALLGRIFDPVANASLEERERLNAEASSYAQNNAIKSFFIGLAADFGGNLPTEIAIALSGAWLGRAAIAMGKAPNASRAAKRMARGAEIIEDAFTTGKQGTRLRRLAIRGSTDFAAGSLAAYMDSTLKDMGGQRVTSDELMNRMIMEGFAGATFGEFIRGAIKLGGSVPQIRNKVNALLPDKVKFNDDQIQSLIARADSDKINPNVEADAPAPISARAPS